MPAVKRRKGAYSLSRRLKSFCVLNITPYMTSYIKQTPLLVINDDFYVKFKIYIVYYITV